MKNILKLTRLLLLLALPATIWSCSKEEITVDPALGYIETYDVPPAGEPGTFQALVRHFYDEYGTYIMYDFTEQELRYTFTYTSAYDLAYTPVEEAPLLKD